MQNTARIQAHPNTLIKNFFVSGVQQLDLQEKLFDFYDDKGDQINPQLKDNVSSITPEILFSMYQDKDDVEKYLPFVFPRKITVNFKPEESIPSFFTFVSTDEKGDCSYFHCLTYFERTDDQTLLNDIDFEKVKDEIKIRERQQKRKEAQLNKKRELKASVSNETQLGTQLIRKETKRSSVIQDEEEDGNLAFDQQTTSNQYDLVQTLRNKTPTINQIKKNEQTMDDLQKISARVTLQQALKEGAPSILKNQDIMESIQEVDEPDHEVRQSNQSAVELSSEDQQSNHRSNTNSNIENNPSFSSQTEEIEDEKITEIFIPIAFVIQTEVEYHDIFRELMLQLFETIRSPRQCLDKDGNKIEICFGNKRKLAFADFLAHIAFLKTIPCPSFNTCYNIEFFQKTLVINEGPFNQIPDRNQIAIKLLFDILDIQSILFCWKALLFDYSLVLISSQYSLQFNVAEALKQLMFPLAWQHQYIQPANEDLIDLIESPTPVLLCCSPYDFLKFNMTPFQYFQTLFEQGFKNIAICDIDGCYTNANDITQDYIKMKQQNQGIQHPFPDLYMEQFQKTQLNILKHKQLMSFDDAFHKPDDDSQFVTDIRQIFFSFLKPILYWVEKRIKDDFKGDNFKEKVDELGTVFDKYFDKEEFLKDFEGSDLLPFVERLADGASFQHFCDDFFSEEVTNYQMFQAIIKGDDDSHDKPFEKEKESRQSEESKEFEVSDLLREHRQNSSQAIYKSSGKRVKCAGLRKYFVGKIENTIKQYKGINMWKFSPFIIDWKMPEDCQRVMLFEKLEYFLNEIDQEKVQCIKSENKYALTKSCSGLSTFSTSSGSESSKDEKLSKIIDEAGEQKEPQYKLVIQMIKDVYALYSPEYKEQREIFKRFSSANATNSIFAQSEENKTFSVQSNSEQSQDNAIQLTISPLEDHIVVDAGKKKLNQTIFSSLSTEEIKNLERFTPKRKVSSAAQDFLKCERKNKAMKKAEKLEEYLKNCPYRNVNLTYGMFGFLDFLKDIFGEIVLKDKTKAFNFYFSLKTLFDHFESYSEENKVEFFQSQNPFVIQNQQNQQQQIKSIVGQSNQSNFTIIKSNQVKNGFDTQFQKDQGEGDYIRSDIWMMPNEWKKNYKSMRRSPQYIVPKVKFFSKFEDPEDRMANTFRELLKYPYGKQATRAEDLFPKVRFKYFLKTMTQALQIELLQILEMSSAQDDSDEKMIQCKIIEQLIQAEKAQEGKKAKKILSLDDSVFKKIDLCAIVNERNQKKQEIKQAEEQKEFLQNSMRNTNPVSKEELKNQSKKLKEKMHNHKVDKEERNFIERGLAKLFDIESKKEKEKKNTIKQTCIDKITAKQMDRRTSHNVSIGPPSFANQIKSSDSEESKQTKTAFKGDTLKVPSNNTGERANSYQDQQYMTINHSLVSELNTIPTYQKQSTMQEQAEPQDLQEKITPNADVKSQKLLKLMIEFFSENDEKEKNLELNSKPVKACLRDHLQEKLYNIHLKALKLAETRTKLIFDIFESSLNQQEEQAKQCFWLNILNFMTLYKLAEIKLTRPEVLKQLNNYAMWHSLMLNNIIIISGVELSQYVIFHSILRQKQEMPNLNIIFEPPTPKENLDIRIQHLVVNNPSQFLAFGLFLPIKKMPNLKIFVKGKFEEQLQSSVRYITKGQLNATTNNLLVTIPKFIKMFQKDFAKSSEDTFLLNSQSITQNKQDDDQSKEDETSKAETFDEQEKCFENLLDIISSNERLNCSDYECQERKELVKMMKIERKLTGKLLHQFQCNPFEWQLNANYFNSQIKDVVSRQSLGFFE